MYRAVKMKYFFLAVVLVLLAGGFSVASSQARVLIVATREDAAPLVMPDRISGLEIDIVREAFRLGGYEIEIVILPPLRVRDALMEGRVDAAFPLKAHTETSLFYSDSYYTIQNIAVSLEEQKARIDQVSDLGMYAVVAFQGAAQWLPKAFRDMAAANSSYQELKNQKGQVRSFFMRRDRVIVLDQTIFRYYAGQKGINPDGLSYVEHSILPPAPVSLGFSDGALQKAFNAGLRLLRNNGEYEAIIRRYTESAP